MQECQRPGVLCRIKEFKSRLDVGISGPISVCTDVKEEEFWKFGRMRSLFQGRILPRTMCLWGSRPMELSVDGEGTEQEVRGY